jgi:WD40 repeat protein
VRLIFSLIPVLIFIFAFQAALQTQESLPVINNVSSVDYSSDGTKIAVGGGRQDCLGDGGMISDYAIRILDAPTGQLLNTLEGHTCATNQVSWDASGTYLASSSNDGSVRVWDVSNKSQISIFGASGSGSEAEPFEGVTWNDNLEQIAAFQGRAILILDAITGELIKTLTDTEDRKRITAIAWNPTGDLLTATTLSNNIKVWDVGNRNLDQPVLTFGTTAFTTIEWSPDGNRIVAGGDDGSLQLFDATTGQLLETLTGHTQFITSVAWSKDGNRIASVSWDGSVRIWDAATSHQLDLFNNTVAVYAVDWNPDGKTLVYGGAKSLSITIVTPKITIPITTPTAPF